MQMWTLLKKLQSSAQSWKGATLMRQTLIMCVHESWVSSEARSGSVVFQIMVWVRMCAD